MKKLRPKKLVWIQENEMWVAYLEGDQLTFNNALFAFGKVKMSTRKQLIGLEAWAPSWTRQQLSLSKAKKLAARALVTYRRKLNKRFYV